MYASQQAVRSQQREGGSRQAAACPVRGRGARHPHSHFLSPHLAQQGQEDRAAGPASWVGWGTDGDGGAGQTHTTCAGHGNLSGPRTMHGPGAPIEDGRKDDEHFAWLTLPLACSMLCPLPALVASWVFVPAGDNKFRIDLSPSWTAAIQREVEKRVRTVTGRGMAWPGPAPSGSPRPCSLFLFRCRLFAPSHLS